MHACSPTYFVHIALEDVKKQLSTAKDEIATLKEQVREMATLKEQVREMATLKEQVALLMKSHQNRA